MIVKTFWNRFARSWCSKRWFCIENLTKSIKIFQNSLIRPVGKVAPKTEKFQKLQSWWIEADLLRASRPLFCWSIPSMDMFLVSFQTDFREITSNPLKFHQSGCKNRENPRLLYFTMVFPYKTNQKSRLFSQPWWIEGDLSVGSRVVLSGSSASLETYLVSFQTNLDGVASNPPYPTYLEPSKPDFLVILGMAGWRSGKSRVWGIEIGGVGRVWDNSIQICLKRH